MIAKLPIIASPIKCTDLLNSIFLTRRNSIIDDFGFALSELIFAKYVYLTDSGRLSFYIILQALTGKSKRKEVVLPAYTAGSLVVAVIKAGLRPVLCDISLVDFNLDRGSLSKVLSPDTLAVVGVHMFGVPMQIRQLRQKMPPEIFLIEDCAQAMGSIINEEQVGSLGDISFFSFNRGKNLPIYRGGCIATNNKEVAISIEKETKSLKKKNFFDGISCPFKTFAFLLATKPLIFGLSYPLISCFKDDVPPADIASKKIDKFQASLGLVILKRIQELAQQRYQNGMFLINALRHTKGIRIPIVDGNIYTVFNRFPILFENMDKMRLVGKKLWENGIETSRMYIRPLHRMFDLGYKDDAFPNANYFAEHLLTLPVHPLVREKDLSVMIEVIRDIAGN